jgi:hypothetical protein
MGKPDEEKMADCGWLLRALAGDSNKGRTRCRIELPLWEVRDQGMSSWRPVRIPAADHPLADKAWPKVWAAPSTI